MSTRLFGILAAISCIIGILLLLPSFFINPGPPANPTVSQLIEFAKLYRTSVLVGAWLQAVSPFFIILFALAIVHLSGATSRFSGWMTMVGGTVLIMTSLIEVSFYLNAINGNPATTGLFSLDLIASVQHIYSMVAAPSVFLPLGIVILRAKVLPRLFGYLALVLAVIFAALGIVALFLPIQHIVDILASVQGIWWLSAAIVLLVSSLRAQPALLED